MASPSAESRLYELHAELCKTLSSPVRLRILNLLRDSEKTVSELVAATGLRQANLSQHLAVLRQRGIVAVRKEGVNAYYEVANRKMIRACDIIREVLLEQLSEAEELARRASRGEQR
jgi:ArsR family transcriptional regulator